MMPIFEREVILVPMKQLLVIVLISVFFFSCKQEQPDPYALPDSYSNQSLGKSANDLLSDTKYTALNVQIQYMPGYAPDSQAVSNLSAFLNSVCNKPAGIMINTMEIPGSGDSITPLKAALIEKKYRTAYTSGTTISVYVLITDGYDTSVTTLGFAFRNTSVCLLGKDISDHSGNTGSTGGITRAALTTSVLDHEICHLLGLVDLGSPVQTAHRDVAHGFHCTNTSCLMHYAIELHKGLGAYTKIPVLDSNCLHDLRANGGR